jgi:hypothetical protein
MPPANTLAYHDTTTITALKGFMIQAPGKTRHTLKMALTDNAIKLSYNCKKNYPN